MMDRSDHQPLDLAERFTSDGYVVLDDVFEPDFVDAMRAEYEHQFPDVAKTPGAHIVGEGRIQVTVQMTGPFLSPQLYANPKILAIVEDLLGEDIVIDNLSLVSALPGAAVQHLHHDHPDLFPKDPFLRSVAKPYAINLAIPLVDLTPDTGTTKLFTASHNRLWSEDRFELPYCRRGGCYLMDLRVKHRGMENHSAAERPIVYLAYARSWFTDIKNYGDNVRINIDAADLPAIPADRRPLFRRLAAKGAFDRTHKELFETLGGAPERRP